MKTLGLSRATIRVYSVALCASLCLSGQLAAGNRPGTDHRDGPFEQPVGAVTGFWATQSHELAPSHWKAYWIWEDTGAQQNMNRMVLARKRFVLDDAPRTARLHITADSSYQLYVNGVFVLRGPAKCAPHHQSFDVVDVASPRCCWMASDKSSRAPGRVFTSFRKDDTGYGFPGTRRIKLRERSER